MAFAAGGVARGAAGAASRGAASKGAAGAAAGGARGGGSAFGTAAKVRQDPQLAKELADLNGETPKPAAKPSPEPAPSGSGEPAAPKRSKLPSGSPSKGLSSATAALSDPAGTPKWFKDAAKVSSPTYALNAGGGAVLGVMAWVVGLTYLRDGKPGVQRWFRAKFLNQVEGS